METGNACTNIPAQTPACPPEVRMDLPAPRKGGQVRTWHCAVTSPDEGVASGGVISGGPGPCLLSRARGVAAAWNPPPLSAPQTRPRLLSVQTPPIRSAPLPLDVAPPCARDALGAPSPVCPGGCDRRSSAYWLGAHTHARTHARCTSAVRFQQRRPRWRPDGTLRPASSSGMRR